GRVPRHSAFETVLPHCFARKHRSDAPRPFRRVAQFLEPLPARHPQPHPTRAQTSLPARTSAQSRARCRLLRPSQSRFCSEAAVRSSSFLFQSCSHPASPSSHQPATRFVNVPLFSIVAITSSPALIHNSYLRPIHTPLGVPQKF